MEKVSSAKAARSSEGQWPMMMTHSLTQANVKTILYT